jgi:VanZ family protein
MFVKSHCLSGNGFLFYSCVMISIENQFSKHPLLRWLPTLLMVVAIFLFSARPSVDEPSTLLRHIIFKSGHVIGYAMLTLSLWRGLEFRRDRRWLVWLCAILYAVTDEFHQSFVPGRHPAAFDVLVYDNIGSLIALWLASMFIKQKQPTHDELVVETKTLHPS